MYINQFKNPLFNTFLKNLDVKNADSIFSQGDIVEGRVLKLLAGNQALVRMRGIDLVAASQSKLMEGQGIVGRVEDTGPNFTISLMQGQTTGEAKTVELMRFLLPGKAPLGEAVANMANSLENAKLPQDVKQAIDTFAKTAAQSIVEDLGALTPDKVKEFLGKSGVFMEATIKAAVEGKVTPQQLKEALAGDLKAALGKALETLEGKMAQLATELETLNISAGAEEKEAPRGAPIDSPASKPAQSKSPAENAPAPISTPAKGKEEIPVVAPQVSKNAQAAGKILSDLAAVHDAAKEARKALGSIELNQLVNTSVKRDDGTFSAPLLFQLPFAAGDTVETARLYIKPEDGGDADGKKRKKQSGTSVVFMLNMTKLGPVRVDVNVDNKKVHGSVYVLNDTVAKHMKDNATELSKRLEEAGYSAWFDVKTAGHKFVTEEIENMTPISGAGLINIRA